MHYLITRSLVAAVLIAFATSTHGLTINLVRIPNDQEFGFGFTDKATIGSLSPLTLPPQAAGDYSSMNAALELAVAAAADWWRAAIADDFTLDVRYGWSLNLAGTTKADTRSGERVNYPVVGETARSRTTKAVIRFSAQPNVPWFIDSSPPRDLKAIEQGELGQFTPIGSVDANIARDLLIGPPVMANIGRTSLGLFELSALFDLFSTALHEFGHALGMNKETLAIGATGIELTGPRAFADPASLLVLDNPVTGLHLAYNTAVLADGIPEGSRRFLSGIDILAAAQQSDWLRINTNPMSAVPESSSAVLLLIGLASLPRRASALFGTLLTRRSRRR